MVSKGVRPNQLQQAVAEPGKLPKIHLNDYLDHMLSTNNWRKKSASQMLQDLDPYLSQLPIVSVNDISFSESVLCSTFEIRKEYSVSGYPNLGKGFSPKEAKLSGLMESLEMCCIESLIPSEWYDLF